MEITHLPNELALKMDGAEAGDLYSAIEARLDASMSNLQNAWGVEMGSRLLT
jgi:hypothetical protein